MSNPPYKRRSSCCLCGATRLEKVCELAELPCKSPNVGSDAPTDIGNELVPLALYMCGSCKHIQLADIVDPALQYTHYRYNTSISLGLAKHFETSADQICSVVRAKDSQPRILEFGSNVGTLLKVFQDRQWDVLGIEPATQISKVAEEAGIPTRNEFFTLDSAADIEAENGTFDVVAANYVLANIEDVAGTIQGVRRVLNPEGVFVFETQYGVDVFENFLVDTIYHEHISYFNIIPLSHLFQSNDMKIVDVQRIPTKGGSIRVFAKHLSSETAAAPVVGNMIDWEQTARYDSDEPMSVFNKRLVANKQAVSAALSSLQSVAGFGASVGAMTLLHVYNVADGVKYICDDNPVQETLRGPDYDIPVVPGDTLYKEPVDGVILFAWRYAKNIIPKHGEFLDRGGRFIVPLPDVEIVTNVSSLDT